MKIKSIRAFIVSVFLVNTLFGTIAIVTSVDQTMFDDNLAESVWYYQAQAGGSGFEHPDNQFEHGVNPSNPFFEGNTSINDGDADNLFSISIDGTNSLSTTLNGVGTPIDEEYAIIGAFNVIWVGIQTNGAVFTTDTFSVTDQVVDGSISLPDLQVVGQNQFAGFKFHLDDELTNIAEMNIVGNYLQNTFLGVENEDITVTYYATFDESIVPEPETYALLFGLVSFMFIMIKRR